MKKGILLILLLAMVIGYGCRKVGSGIASKKGSERAEVLTISVIIRISSFEASVAEYGNRVLFYQAPYDSLLRMEPDGVTISPWLATEWKYDKTRTILTMKLRKDVKFTDGTSFKSDAVVKNLMAFKKGDSPDASNLSDLKEVVALNDYTVELHLDNPNPAILNYLARSTSLMQSPATIGTDKAATYPVGTGPYILKSDETIVDSVYVFYANPDYWAPDYIKYNKFVIKVIEDPTATVNAIRAGEINAATLTNNDVVAEVERAGWTIHPQELDWVGLTLVDRDGSLGSPLKDVRVRQAFNYAFDRKALLEGYGVGYGSATTQVFPPSSPGYDPALDSKYEYNPEKAKQLLAEAGYPNGFTIDLPSVSVLGEAVFAMIGSQLADIGVTVNWTDETADYFSAILAPKYPAYFMFLEQSTNDWQFIQFLISKEAVWNPSHYSDEISEKLISKIQVASKEKAVPLIKQLGAHVVEDAWFAPWYRKQSSFTTDKKTDVELQLGNCYPYLFNFSPLK